MTSRINEWSALREYLGRTQERTATSISHYDQARRQRDKATEDLHRHDMTVRGDHRRHPLDAAQRRVHDLETWRSWAGGQPVAIERLREVATTLAADRDPNQAHSRLLEDAIDRWASNHGIDLNSRQRVDRDRGRVGPELSLVNVAQRPPPSNSAATNTVAKSVVRCASPDIAANPH